MSIVKSWMRSTLTGKRFVLSLLVKFKMSIEFIFRGIFAGPPSFGVHGWHIGKISAFQPKGPHFDPGCAKI